MPKIYHRSEELFRRAQKHIPGGVNSPVRSFKSVGRLPLFVQKGRGAHIYDADGNEYIDYVCSWGPLILGHCHEEVVKSLRECLQVGTSFGASTELEVELAEILVDAVPSMEMVRLVNSGTEATMSALRLARAYTGRNKIVKFQGCYHGHADVLLISMGSGALTLGVPTSPGIPAGVVKDTINLPYNNLEVVKEVFKKIGEEIAAVIVEPVAGNMGVVPPRPGFLHCLREETKRYGSLLIFDEVITGFRLSFGGAQELYGVEPDLTCLGKIIGGGLPVGAYGGKVVFMNQVAPAGPVYQAGTLSGNPLAVTAGLTTLKLLRRPGFYEDLERKSAKLLEGLMEAARECGVEVSFNRVGSMMSVFFTGQEVTDYETACASSTERYAVFFRQMLERGVYLAPSQFEAAFVSGVHTDHMIDLTVKAARDSFFEAFSAGA